MAEAKIKTEPEDPPVIKVEDLVSDSEDSDSVASQPIPKKQKIETITSANELGEGSSTSGISVKTEIKEEPEDNSEYSMEFDETGAVKDEPNTSDEEDDDDFDEDEDQDVEDIEELKFEAEDESLLDKG